jgi:hypothetical protein
MRGWTWQRHNDDDDAREESHGLLNTSFAAPLSQQPHHTHTNRREIPLCITRK